VSEGVLLLCILPEGHEPGTELARLADRPVEGLNFPPLTLWIRTAPRPGAPSLEDVRAHHRIVEGAWAAHPAVLPVRFGQWFATMDELTAAVRPKVEAYVASLERVRGAGEFSVRILDPAAREPAAAGTAGSGTEYLRAAAERSRHRAALDARGRELASELRAALGGLVKDERVDPFPAPQGLAEVAHLVERTREEEYEGRMDAFAATRPELRFLRTGPWPAWTFAA
jgi:hypothetical protein